MNKTKTELKKIAQLALDSEYGFAPALKEITLLEASSDGTKIYFKVNGKEYNFTSHINTYGDMDTIWVGQGTIEKLS